MKYLENQKIFDKNEKNKKVKEPEMNNIIISELKIELNKAKNDISILNNILN